MPHTKTLDDEIRRTWLNNGRDARATARELGISVQRVRDAINDPAAPVTPYTPGSAGT